MHKRVAVFASGNGTNAERLFEYFKNHSSIKIQLLLCNNPSAGVIERAERWSVPVVLFDRNDLKKTRRVQDALKSEAIDWIALAGFLWLLSSDIVSAYPNKIVNLHPSLLPKYGGKGMYGAHVHKAVIEAGDQESGITIHLVNDEYDQGQIIFQARCKVESGDNSDTLASKVHELEYKHFPPTLEKTILGEEP